MRKIPRTVLAALCLTGCYVGEPYNQHGADPGSPSSGHDAGGPGDGQDAGVAAELTGVPCDIAEILVVHCLRCHNGTPLSQSDLPLTTYDDLAAAAPGEHGRQTVGERSVERIHDARSRMPPAPDPPLNPNDARRLEEWVNDGYPRGDCGGGGGEGEDGGVIQLPEDAGIEIPDAGPDPYDTETVCSSGSYWTDDDHGSADMHPGGACIDCHSDHAGFFGIGGAPQFSLAGTVYPTAHEPDDCQGLGEGTIVITDANGHDITLVPNAVGNFSTEDNIATPYFAKLVRNGVERVMTDAQTDGDCNSCHTERGTHTAGDDDAPGRLMLP